MSHHYSGPNYGFPRGDARLDLTDLYVFPKPGDTHKSIVVMNVHPGVGVEPPGPTTPEPFSGEAVYEIRIDTNADLVPDVAYRVTFSPIREGRQFATLRIAQGEQAKALGDAGRTIIDGAVVSIGSEVHVAEADGHRLFAGWRSDPFFFDTAGALAGMTFTARCTRT